jgi:hypothetical protein
MSSNKLFNIDGDQGNSYNISDLENIAIDDLNAYLRCYKNNNNCSDDITNLYKNVLHSSIALEKAMYYIKTGNTYSSTQISTQTSTGTTASGTTTTGIIASETTTTGTTASETTTTGTTGVTSATSSPYSQYDASFNEISNNYKYIVELRNKLDIKLKNLSMDNSSMYGDYKMNYDATVYSGVLWTILATSLIYYVFRHL